MMEGEILQRVRELERQVKVLLELHPDARAILNSGSDSHRITLSSRPSLIPREMITDLPSEAKEFKLGITLK